MHNLAHLWTAEDGYLGKDEAVICLWETQKMMAPLADLSGLDAPPLRMFTGQNRWCNFTSSPWQRKTGGERGVGEGREEGC